MKTRLSALQKSSLLPRLFPDCSANSPRAFLRHHRAVHARQRGVRKTCCAPIVLREFHPFDKYRHSRHWQQSPQRCSYPKMRAHHSRRNGRGAQPFAEQAPNFPQQSCHGLSSRIIRSKRFSDFSCHFLFHYSYLSLSTASRVMVVIKPALREEQDG